MACPIHDVIQRSVPPNLNKAAGRNDLFFEMRFARCKSHTDEQLARNFRIRGSGGARRDRTDDLLLAKQALSQLSYGPDFGKRWSEGARQKWWAWEDLNFRPHAYQARALTS
jgi:hypothetical protein